MAFLEIRDWALAEGEPFTERDILNSNRVCLLGQTLVRELFQGESPVGKEVRVKDVSFRVVGVLAPKGANMMGSDQDDILLAPWTTIKYRVTRSSLATTNQSAAAVVRQQRQHAQPSVPLRRARPLPQALGKPGRQQPHARAFHQHRPDPDRRLEPR